MDYTGMSTADLRTLVRDRGLAKGAAVASARKDDLIALLNGTSTELETPTLAAAADGIGAALGVDSTPAEPTADLASVIAAAISDKINPGVDTEAVEKIAHQCAADTLTAWVDDNLDTLIRDRIPETPTVNTLSIEYPEIAEPITLDDGEPVHKQFPQVLAWLRADVPVWLWGLPGGGKTHLGRQIARALDVAPYVMSIDETTTANKLLGFQNLVSGAFVPGWLYEPYCNGGLVVIDEIDTGNPGIIAGLNALLANDHYMFPNGETVKRHESFRVLACANTNGTGAVAGFTARQRLDATTLDRFAIVSMEYDEGLELQIACGIPSQSELWSPGAAASPEDCQAWVSWVQSVRAAVGENVLVSPRPSLLGVKAFRAGVPIEEVAQALVFALCAADTVSTIKDRCGDPAKIVASTEKAVA